MDATSSPLPPLSAVRTVYPKSSRNAFSHSSTSWLSSMQRSTPLDSSGRADRGMVHLQGTISQYRGTLKCSKLHRLPAPAPAFFPPRFRSSTDRQNKARPAPTKPGGGLLSPLHGKRSGAQVEQGEEISILDTFRLEYCPN